MRPGHACHTSPNLLFVPADNVTTALPRCSAQFAGLGHKPESWVKKNNIVAFFEAPNSSNRKVRPLGGNAGQAAAALQQRWLAPAP